MYEVWEEYFNDVPRQNFVISKFGKYSKRQLGCIKYASDSTKVKMLLKKYQEDISSQDINSVSVILLTRYFMDDSVPELLLISTLSHEICHYSHGFHSPLERKYRYPHKGGVVTREMRNRGLGEVLDQSEAWLKDNWINIVYKD